MTAHTHTERVPGCFRCDLGADESESSMLFEIEDLEAENERLREHRLLLRGALNSADTVLADHEHDEGESCFGCYTADKIAKALSATTPE